MIDNETLHALTQIDCEGTKGHTRCKNDDFGTCYDCVHGQLRAIHLLAVEVEERRKAAGE